MSPTILRLPELESTNRYALERFHELAHGFVVVADRQSAGRGRLGRRWLSSVAGNLYASLVLKAGAAAGRRGQEQPPQASEPGLTNLTQYMAVVLARVLARWGAKPTLKWPNDVLVSGCKIAGILAEAVAAEGRLVGVVLGVGVNLAMTPEDLAAIDQPATSLNIVLGRPVDRDEFLGATLEEFFDGYAAFVETGFPAIRQEFLSLTPFLGSSISVHLQQSRITGTACDIALDGSLVVLTPQGRVRLTVGDVQ